MIDNRMREDVAMLIAGVGRRGPNTEGERVAAERIAERMRPMAAYTEIDGFRSIESRHVLFGAYYAEFLFIAVIAHWLEVIAFAYGVLVFVLYLAETMGYRVLGGLLPQFRSQNVIGRFPCAGTAKRVVVTAHYDTPRVCFLERLETLRRLERPAHWAVAVAMVAVLATCLADALSEGPPGSALLGVRWSCAAFLTCAALLRLYCEYAGSYADDPGAGASGAAVLLDLGSRFSQRPLEGAGLWLAATGSKHGWLGGMRHLLAHTGLRRPETLVICLDAPGAGPPELTLSQGPLHRYHTPQPLAALAKRVALEHGVAANASGERLTEAYPALARGFDAIAVAGSGRMNSDASAAQPDYEAMARTADYAEALIRAWSRNSGETP